MTKPDQKYVTSTRPINRRTATKQALHAPSINPVVQERLAAIKARNRFGPPLADQFRLSRHESRKVRLSFWLVLGAILSAISSVALLLAWIQSSLPLASAGMLGLPAAIAMILYGRRAEADFRNKDDPRGTLFDEATLQAFDQLLDELASEVPEEISARLSELKQQVVRIAKRVSASSVDEQYTMEDRMYLRESVRRYLPDSLQSYLKVPQNQRSTQLLNQGQTADSLLLVQLNLLRIELDKQEVKLAKSTAEDLVKQQRFLEAKAKRQ